MSTSLQALHDKMLAAKPDGVEHNTVEDPCPMCLRTEVLRAAAEDTSNNRPGGELMDTFTKEQVDAAIAEAVSKATAPLQDRVNELEAVSKDSELEAAVAAVASEKDAALAELQAKLDEAEARAHAAETAKTEVDAFWENAIAEETANAEKAARLEARVTELKAAKVFADEFVDEHAERFAAMSDEDWSERMDEWKAVAKPSEIPAYTGFKASREDASVNTGSALSEIGGLRRALVDPRTL